MAYKTISIENHQGKKVVKVLERRIYLGITDVFREEVQELLQDDFKELIFDMQNVSVMNSSGLGVLIMARDELSRRGGKVKIANLQPLMQEIFTRMRLDTLFPLFKSIEDALAG